MQHNCPYAGDSWTMEKKLAEQSCSGSSSRFGASKVASDAVGTASKAGQEFHSPGSVVHSPATTFRDARAVSGRCRWLLVPHSAKRRSISNGEFFSTSNTRDDAVTTHVDPVLWIGWRMTLCKILQVVDIFHKKHVAICLADLVTKKMKTVTLIKSELFDVVATKSSNHHCRMLLFSDRLIVQQRPTSTRGASAMTGRRTDLRD